MRKIYALPVLLMALWGSRPLSAQVVVIANRSAKVSEISVGDLRNIFLGSTTRFRNGSTALPVLLHSGSETDEFLASYIGKVDSSFRSYWRSLVFTGQAAMPKTEDDDAAMVAYVASTPGAIGYVNKTAVKETVVTVTVR